MKEPESGIKPDGRAPGIFVHAAVAAEKTESVGIKLAKTK